MKKLNKEQIAVLATAHEDEYAILFPGFKRDYLRRTKRRALDSISKIGSVVAQDKQKDIYETELKVLSRKYKEAIKLANTQERILDFNRSAIQALPPVGYPKSFKIKDDAVVESAVLVGSCWHIGEVINKEEMGGINEYNFDIFVKRFQYLIDKVLTFCFGNVSKHSFQDLHVLLTGDMVSGIIHSELEASNQLTIVEQAHLGALIVAQGIRDLAKHFPRVVVTCVVGNHGRVTPQKYFKHKQTVNWDYVFYQTLALLLQKQENVHFNIPMSFWAGIEIQGHKFFITHGDMAKSWGGIPFYGINRESSKWMEIMASAKEFYEYFVASHFHTKAVLQSAVGEKILNGSLKGGDEFAAGLGLYGDPIQLLFGVHHRYGKTWELSINTKFASGEIRYKCDRSTGLDQQHLKQ